MVQHPRVAQAILLVSVVMSFIGGWIIAGDVMVAVSFSSVWTLAVTSLAVGVGVAIDRVTSRASFLIAASLAFAVIDTVVFWLVLQMSSLPQGMGWTIESLGVLAVSALTVGAVTAVVRKLLHHNAA